MDNNYIEQFGDNKRSVRSENPKLCFVPLIMGILSFISFAVYLWSAFHARSVVMCVIYFVPIYSIVGLAFSFITRHSKDKHFAIWLIGLTGCLLSLVFYVVLFFATWAALAQR